MTSTATCGPASDGNPLKARKILIMGLPGAGKTTLARQLSALLKAVVFNADEVRANINRDLGFSIEDRIEHARRMGWLCDQVVQAGHMAIADFVCPMPQTRTAFGSAFVIFVDPINASRFDDTNKIFVAPEAYDARVTPEHAPDCWADDIVNQMRASA